MHSYNTTLGGFLASNFPILAFLFLLHVDDVFASDGPFCLYPCCIRFLWVFQRLDWAHAHSEFWIMAFHPFRLQSAQESFSHIFPVRHSQVLPQVKYWRLHKGNTAVDADTTVVFYMQWWTPHFSMQNQSTIFCSFIRAFCTKTLYNKQMSYQRQSAGVPRCITSTFDTWIYGMFYYWIYPPSW